METLIIQVNCERLHPNKPPQLGITVHAPDSSTLQQRQTQQQARNYRYHDYQNCHTNNNVGTNTSKCIQNGITNNYSIANNKKLNIVPASLGKQKQLGLQIIDIQKGSVIDRNGQFRINDIIVEVNGINLQRREFHEAQEILREFVVRQSSHSPLNLKVLRRAASSSSLPSTTDSQTTVIERDQGSNNLSLSSTSQTTTITSPKKQSFNSTSTPSPQSSNRGHFVGALNTRRIGTKYRFRLTKSENGGFGFKIAERDNMFGSNRPIYITAITTTGSAYRDGRLKEGDMLLEVNGINLSEKSQPEVTKMLKSVGVNESVEFLVSRQEDNHINHDYLNIDQENSMSTSKPKLSTGDCDNNKSLIDLDVPDREDFVFTDATDHRFEEKIDRILNVPSKEGPGTYVYDIPLNDTKSAGLGLYLKYITLDGKDLGIWIEKVITGGAAWKDGRLQPDDQILAINGINLMKLSNAEASETLMAAVCRGIGPEATSHTIRLNIHRRDPLVVAKILHGTNNRIQHSDLPPNGYEKSYGSDKFMNSTQDSYRTAFENTMHKSQSSIDTSGSNKSSNQNSQEDSALSPQTQASNSIKLSNPSNEKFDQNSSDKTNDTSSAISQITDFTSVPINENTASDREYSHSDNLTAFTLPKTLDLAENIQSIDPASSIQSWDDESVDAATGEERFQRDGFGRQSISEKRHAQLMAKNTDTYKRNQKLKEERERQRQLEEQMERQRLDDERRLSLNIMNAKHHQRMPSSVTVHDIDSAYTRNIQILPNNNNQMAEVNVNHYAHREVPVDVQQPLEPSIRGEQLYNRTPGNTQDSIRNHSKNRSRLDQYVNELSRLDNQAANRCQKCGSVGLCHCRGTSLGRPQLYQIGSGGYDNPALKRSNSLESIQHHEPMREGLIVPRAGTVRVARNRKINESFRAAVDRSYEGSMNDTSFVGNDSRSNTSNKMTNSIANSTTSTSNDERYLIVDTNGKNTPAHKKSSSLLTRFLKFGSMKKDKKRNKDDQQTNSKLSDSKTVKDSSSRDPETSRSQTSKSSHSRTHSSHSHPNGPSSYNQQYQQQLLSNSHVRNEGMNNQLYNNNIKQQSSQQPHPLQASIQFHNQNPHRSSMHMYQYQPVNNNLSTHNNSITYSKLAANIQNRPSNLMGNHQYSQVPVHHQVPPLPPLNHPQQQLHQQIPVDIHNQPVQFQPVVSRNHMVQNHHIGLPNGCHPSHQWQSPPVHALNGLWVANSPVSDGQAHHRNIYGSHAQHVAHFHNQQQPSVNISHPTPFIPPMNGPHSSNGLLHQSPILQGHTPTMTQQHLHNQQPQHIYYYDF